MPSPTRTERLVSPAAITYDVALEPAASALDSIMLLNSIPDVSGLSDWVVETANAMPPELKWTHRVVLKGLYFAVQPRVRGLTFPEHVEHLASAAPEDLRDRVLSELLALAPVEQRSPDVTAGLLGNLDAYLTFLRATFPDGSLDTAVEAEAHRLLNRPAELQRVVVAHLRLIWERYFADEWERCLPLLRESVAALRRLPVAGMEPLDAVRAITGHQLLGERQRILGTASQIIFVPSVHTGPYLDTFSDGDLMWLIFGARVPDAPGVSPSALSRSDLLVRLSALTDDTRLRMLALLGQQGELCAPEIMTRLRLTQSATSRHLRQLSATGYLVERRRDGAKCYSLHRDRLAETFRALDAYVTSHNDAG